MSKGLEELKRLPKAIKDTFKDSFDIIKQELKEYEQHEEILNNYGLTLVNFREACLLLAMLKGNGRNIHNIDKQLKALEIIKNKKVDIRSLDNIICLCATDESALKEYNRCCGKDEEDNDISLTQEEYDLLKEVLL